jgi:hypothetical protein
LLCRNVASLGKIQRLIGGLNLRPCGPVTRRTCFESTPWRLVREVRIRYGLATPAAHAESRLHALTWCVVHIKVSRLIIAWEASFVGILFWISCLIMIIIDRIWFLAATLSPIRGCVVPAPICGFGTVSVLLGVSAARLACGRRSVSISSTFRTVVTSAPTCNAFARW